MKNKLIFFLFSFILLSSYSYATDILGARPLGMGGAFILGIAVPSLPTHTPLLYVFYAELLAVFIGLLSGAMPAWRASRLDPVEALRSE